MENPTIPKPRNFLVVEDDPIIRADISAIVQDCGFDVWQAANTSEALSLLAAAPETFAALITDIQMPGTRSGAVLARHTQAMWPHIRIIVLTGGRMPLQGELPYDARVLPKPVSVPTLAQLIQGAA